MAAVLDWLRRWLGRRPGAAGERRAARYLRRQGHRILERNWRHGKDEIDLITLDSRVLVIVEVKSRAAEALVPGYYAAVAPEKKQALIRAARAYLRRLQPKPVTIRYDVIEISHQPGERGGELRHYENVPLFSKRFRW